jgi:phosphoribosyl 1,2-cyclic phosphodiesterase
VLRVTVLGSGSRGNAILVDGTLGTLLIDAGFGPRTIARRLALVNRRPEQISALLLTHEHTDHASGAAAASTRWGWPVHAVADTLEALRTTADGGPRHTACLAFGSDDAVSGFRVQCVAVPHDAAACTAFVLTDESSGARVGIALDLGHVPDALPTALARCDLLVVESNHDERMLAEGPYPWPLKQRVGGQLGHLSNGAAAALAAGAAHSGLRGVILAHLSETNNTPARALQRTRDALRRAGWRRDALWAAHQTVPCGPISADGVSDHTSATQLTLGF